VSITQAESSDYLAERTPKRGSAGWLLLAGLGVSYAISGDYSGWNFGLPEGGFGGLLIAGAVIAATSFALVIAALSVVATFVVDSTVAFWCLVVFAAFIAYFGLYRRRHLVANSPDEEFAALAAAEEELE
jgi:hypothetical protein